MTFEKWSAVITHLFVLCGVRKMDDIQHSYYVSAMFAELKERFTDDEIGVAARRIAETENLYGAYPSLATWLKYAPAERLRMHTSNIQIANVRDFLHDIAEMDAMVFDASLMESHFINTYGDHGKFVLDEFGGVRGLRSALYNASQFTIESLIKDFITAWARAETDMYMNVPQIIQEKTLQIK